MSLSPSSCEKRRARRGRPPCASLDFELSSRGDRVPGRLLLPANRQGPFPLILAQHGAGGAKDADYMGIACLPWVRGGAAVASIDFPLHGARANAKLGERILGLFEARSDLSRFDAELWICFVRQGVIDLRRTLDAVAELAEIDAGRIAYAGFSLGTILGVPFCAEDARIQAAALAIGGGGRMGPVASDPVGHIPRLCPAAGPVRQCHPRRDRTARERRGPSPGRQKPQGRALVRLHPLGASGRRTQGDVAFSGAPPGDQRHLGDAATALC